MTLQRRAFPAMMLSAATVLSTPLLAPAAHAASGEDLQKQAQFTLKTLYKARPGSEALAQKAKAALVFPNIIKAGLIFGGAYGEGVLLQNQVFAGYFNSVSASFGLQAGAQSFGYVLFVMTDAAVESPKGRDGWELGVGPSIVVVDSGVASKLSTTTLKDDVYAYIFDQSGMMASLGLEGTKISRIKQP